MHWIHHLSWSRRRVGDGDGDDRRRRADCVVSSSFEKLACWSDAFGQTIW